MKIEWKVAEVMFHGKLKCKSCFICIGVLGQKPLAKIHRTVSPPVKNQPRAIAPQHKIPPDTIIPKNKYIPLKNCPLLQINLQNSLPHSPNVHNSFQAMLHLFATYPQVAGTYGKYKKKIKTYDHIFWNCLVLTSLLHEVRHFNMKYPFPSSHVLPSVLLMIIAWVLEA